MYNLERDKLRNYLGNDIYNILKSHNCIVAGGAILSIFNNTEINDIDVYFRNKNDFKEFLKREMSNIWIISYTKKAILFKVKNNLGKEIEVQTIYFRYFDTPEDIFESFDFTVCMAAYDFKSEAFVLHEDFLKHNVSKILVFNEKTDYPLITAMRVQKYKDKGFNISKLEFMRLMLTVNNLKINNYEELKEQIGGMYGESYDEILEPMNEEPFNLLNIIKDMSKISYENHDKKLNSLGTWIEDWDKFTKTFHKY